MANANEEYEGGHAIFDSTSGKPDTSRADPSEFYNGYIKPYGGGLCPILPYDAAVQMAELTFTTNDEPGHSVYDDTDEPLDADRLPETPYLKDTTLVNPEFAYHTLVEERALTLLNYAVYYVACAIIWVLQHTDVEKRGDTTSDRLYETVPSIETPVSQRHPHYTYNDILEAIKEKNSGNPQSVTVGGKNIVLAMGMMVPMMALTSIGLGSSLNETIKQSKRSKWEPSKDLETQDEVSTESSKTIEGTETSNVEPSVQRDLQSELDEFLPSPPSSNTSPKSTTEKPNKNIGKQLIKTK